MMIDWRGIGLQKWFSVILVLSLQLSGASSNNDESKLVTSVNDFSYRFYKHLTVKKKESFICSPYSASVALSMLLVGAKAETAAEISKTLGYEATGLAIQQIQDVYHKLLSDQSSPKAGFDLAVANSLWVKLGEKLLPEYLSAIEKNFFAIGKEVDFKQSSTKNEINEWISTTTKGKISEMLKELQPDTVLLLINALYFKGQWEEPFNNNRTSDQDFHNAFSNSIKKVPMMTNGGDFKHAYIKSLKANILQLPYKGNEYSMLILLPDEKNGLLEIEKALTVKMIDDAIKESYSRSISLHLPKFNLSTTLTLNDVLKSLGTKLAFLERGADLSGINGNGSPLYVSKVIQKAICEVNEEGTIAAAATGILVDVPMSMPEPALEFSVDHPFLFLIRHEKSGIVLFMGRVFEL